MNNIQKEWKEKLLNLTSKSIKDKTLKSETLNFLKNTAPNYFWEAPASSSGKFHPPLSQGDAGLVRHTYFATKLLLEMSGLDYIKSKYSSKSIDEMIVAIILHDTFKLGLEGGNKTDSHHELLPIFHLPTELKPCGILIATHMGEWGAVKPKNEREYLVHLADYLASRRMFQEVELND